MINPAVNGLAAAGTPKVGRNLNLNEAYQPPWDQTDAMQAGALGDFMPQGNTNFDPFQGTQWGRYLDTLSEQAPGGIKTPSGHGDPLSGLQRATPMAAFTEPTPVAAPTPTVSTPTASTPTADMRLIAGAPDVESPHMKAVRYNATGNITPVMSPLNR